MDSNGTQTQSGSSPSPEDTSGYLVEYKELRTEIRMYLDRRTKNTQFAYVFVAAVIGLYGQISSPYFFLAGSLVVAFIWFDQIRQLRAVIRTAAYLELFVEPRVVGLNWETLGAHHPITMRRKNKSSFAERAIANGAFPLFLVGLGAIAILDKASSWSSEVRIAVACVLFLLFLFLIRASYERLDREEQLEAWRLVQQKIVEKRESPSSTGGRPS